MGDFIETEYYGITGVTGEDTINQELFNYGNGVIQVLVTEEPLSKGEATNYFNVYVISDKFSKVPNNCLHLQEPKADLIRLNPDFDPKTHFNELYLEKQAIGHYLWDKYYDGEEPKSFWVEETQ